jgi:butyrate kinase
VLGLLESERKEMVIENKSSLNFHSFHRKTIKEVEEYEKLLDEEELREQDLRDTDYLIKDIKSSGSIT